MRDIPQYIAQLQIGSMPQVQFTDAPAQMLSNLSSEFQAIALDIQKKNNDMFELKTETEYKENLNRIYSQNSSNPENFDKEYNSFYKEFSAKLPDSDVKSRLDVQHNLFAQSYRDRVTEQYYSNQENEYKATQLKALQVNKNLLNEAYKQFANAVTPEARQSAMEQINLINENDSQILSSTDYKGSARYSPEFQVRDLIERGTMAFQALPPLKRMEALGDVGGGFEYAQQLVDKHEGGFNPSDGLTGEPALFGINRKWHKEAYAKVEAAYRSGGEAAGKTVAQDYLKKTFWDANNIDSLPPEVQGIVYDGAVNQGNNFAEKLINAVKEGAGPSQLLEMRQKEYDRLAKGGKFKPSIIASWNNRLNSYRHLEISDYKQYVDAETRDRLVNAARSELEQEAKLWRDNAPKAAMQNGARTPFEMVQAQVQKGVPRQFARVIDNERAKTYGQRINQARTSDEILQLAAEINADYGEFTPNAMQDLQEFGGVKKETQAALFLATTGKPEYKEHIDLLTEAGAVGQEAVNKLFSQNGFDSKELSKNLFEKMQDYQIALRQEGRGEEIAERMQVMLSLAKARTNQTLSDSGGWAGSSFGKSIDFAMQPINDMYALRDIGKGVMRIPTQYNADTISDAVESFIKYRMPEVVAKSRFEGYVLNDEFVPYLNEFEDGVKFRSIQTGETISAADGKAIDLKFKELLETTKVSAQKILSNFGVSQQDVETFEQDKAQFMQRLSQPENEPLSLGGR